MSTARQGYFGTDLLPQLQSLKQSHLSKKSPSIDEAMAAVAHAGNLNQQLSPPQPESVLQSADAQAKALMASITQLFHSVIDQLFHSRRALDTFRREHGLIRPASQPDLMMSCGLMALMVLVETVINAGFFVTANMAATPVAALTISFLISLTNVVVSASAGFFIGRFLSYGNEAIRPESYAAERKHAKGLLSIYIGWTTFFVLTIGLVRSQATLEHIHHSIPAYWTLLTNSEALLLMATAVCMAAVSFHKGKTAFADSYPHYSAMHKQVADAEAAKEDVLADGYDSLDELIEDAEEQLLDQQDVFLEQIEAVNDAITQAEQRIRQAEAETQAQKRAYIQARSQLIEQHEAGTGEPYRDLPEDDLDDFTFDLGVALPERLVTPKESDLLSSLYELKAQLHQCLGDVFANDTQQAVKH